MLAAKIAIAQLGNIKMLMHSEKSIFTLEYEDLIRDKFNFLVNFFNFEPGDIFIEILPLEEFERIYRLEKGEEPPSFVVGAALDNGRIIVLDKKDFIKKQGHVEEEFEWVILHEMAHIFVRRLIWPEQAFIWIQEGICEYLSFGHKEFRIKNFVSFKEVESEDGWNKFNPYQQSGAFFKYLSKKYGNKKIVEFIKGLKENSKQQIKYFEKVFSGKFKKIEKNFFKEYENTI